MKTVYSSNRELIHVWANNNESDVYKRANSVSCHYDKLFSYNTCIAQIHGETVIFNSESYSNSTSKHQSLARGAIHGMKAISLDFPRYNLQSLILGQNDFNEVLKEPNEEKAAQLLIKSSRSKKYAELYKAMANNILLSLSEYAELIGLDYYCYNLEELKEQAIINDKARKEREKIQKAEKIKEQAEALEAWRNGEDRRHYFEITALRIKNDEIETTKGARIPLDHAIKAWPLLNRIAHSDEIFMPNNHAIHFGNYRLTRADKKELIVGCHNIPMLEVLNIAKQLNLQGA
jgi:hypothetical protein